jgi:uncharacterized protein with von Willebrand factor type A (vWA) domain
MSGSALEAIALSVYEELRRQGSVPIALLPPPAEDTRKLPQETCSDKYDAVLETVLSYEPLRNLCAEDTDFAGQVADDILDFLMQMGRQMGLQRRKTAGRFSAEEDLLRKFRTIEPGTFLEQWSDIALFLRETYGKNKLDTDFYEKEFVSIFSGDTQNKEDFYSLRDHFSGKWEKLLSVKMNRAGFKKIKTQIKDFCGQLYERVDTFAKLRTMFEPFADAVGGRFWDMSRGLWQESQFNVLEGYVKLMETDKGITEFAEALGRMRSAEREYEEERFAERSMNPEQNTDYALKSDLVGVCESDDISSMLPVEASLLADDETELLFYKKFAEKKLQSFEYIAKIFDEDEKKGTAQKTPRNENPPGPFIICVDTSGSMRGAPEQIAKALSFTLLARAARERRGCYLISFSTRIKTLDLAGIKNSLQELASFLSMSFHGGTDATPALREALGLLETKDYKKADVVVVSDFIMSEIHAQIQQKIQAARKNKTRFYGLAVREGHKSIGIFDCNWLYNPKDRNAMPELVKNLMKLT